MNIVSVREPLQKNKEELEESARAAYEAACGDDPVPSDFFTATQWADLVGKPRRTVSDQLLALVLAGKAEMRPLFVGGRIHSYYRIPMRELA